MRYLGRNRIIYMTMLFLCPIVEPIPARQMLAQQLNRRKRKGRKARRGGATHRDETLHGGPFPLGECDCGCSIDARRHYAEARMNRDKRRDGDEETGKCFRVVPLARSHCYLTRTRRADARRTASEKGKHC